MTIYEIKRRIEGDSYYFSRSTLKFFGQTLKDFSVRKFEDKFLISAPSGSGEESSVGPKDYSTRKPTG
jgi:hypothetical protein